jgi:hypothetical protein
MKIVADDLIQTFHVPEDMPTSKIWDALIKYFVEHNRIFMSANFVFADNTVEITNMQSLSEVFLRDTSELLKIEIKTLPQQPGLLVLFKKINSLKTRITQEIFEPIQQILENKPVDESQSIKLDLFKQTPKKLELLTEMSSVLFRFIYVEKFTDIQTECEILEELIKRIKTVIQHQDMSTLVHLLSYELIQLLEKLNNRLSSKISYFAV